MVLDQYASWAFAGLLEAMAGVLGCGVVVCCLDEGDDQTLDGGEKLVEWSV